MKNHQNNFLFLWDRIKTNLMLKRHVGKLLFSKETKLTLMVNIHQRNNQIYQN